MGATNSIIRKPIISADSHIMEPPGTYVDRIDRKYKESAPKIVPNSARGDIYVIEGMEDTIPMGLVAAAGKTAEELAGAAVTAKFDDLHRGGWDPKARIADQAIHAKRALQPPPVGQPQIVRAADTRPAAATDHLELRGKSFMEPDRKRIVPR